MGIFHAYDIRGIYGKELTDLQAYKLGYYFVKINGLKKIKIGHDSRLSQPVLTKYFIKGALDAHTKIIYLGKLSTPNFYFSLFSGPKDGIMITASHNPKEYNGFKFMKDGKSYDFDTGLKKLQHFSELDLDEKEMEYKIFKPELDKISLQEVLDIKKIKLQSPIKDYQKYLKKKYKKILSRKEIKTLKKISFAIDFSSGVSSLANKEVLKNIGLNFTDLNSNPDGNFPNHTPDPTSATKFLQKRHLTKNFFTAVFDGDGDRILFYDKNNIQILNDYTICSYIDFFSKKLNHFAIDLTVSKAVDLIAKQNKVKITRIKVGRSHYHSFMEKIKCGFGAEKSGHLFFKEFNYLDNPDIGLIYMLKIVAQNLIKDENIQFSQIFSKYKYFAKGKDLTLEVQNPNFILKDIEKKYESKISSKLDGISLDFGNFWCVIRKSNTEPIIRIVSEGKTKEIVDTELKKLKLYINSLNK